MSDPSYSVAIAEADNYTVWLLDTFSAYFGRRVLEVGLGHGAFRHRISDLDLYVGIDIDRDSVAEAERANPRDMYRVMNIADTAAVQELARLSLDTVMCFNVLEHIDDESTAVANMVSVLRPGGHLLLFVPAFEGLYMALDRLAGHLRRYTRESLMRVLPDEVAVLRLEYLNPIGGIGWWLNGFLRHRSLDSKLVSVQIRMFDRLVIPLSRALNPYTKQIFGQSVICVARKR